MKDLTKKTLSLCFLVILSTMLYAQGVDFRNLSLQEALQAAAKENKPVFLDCYTSWCGPCKMMANTVFTQKKAGDYFNTTFVNIKIDMEKGEGPAIAKKYEVSAYPTFLVINPDGKLLHRIVGAETVDNFIKNVEAGLKSANIETLTSLYQAGKLSQKEQLHYWNMLVINGKGSEAMQVGDAIWKGLQEKEKLTDAYWPLLKSKASSIYNEEVKLALDNRKILEKEVGNEEIQGFMYNTLLSELKLMTLYQLPEKRYTALTQVRELIDNNDVPRKEALTVIADLADARGQYKYYDFLEILNQNLDKLNNEEKSFLFEAAKLMGNINEEAYFQRLGEVAFRAIENIQDKETKEKILVIGSSNRRMGSQEAYWDNFKTLESALIQAELEGKKVFLFCYREGQTCNMIQDKIFKDEKVRKLMNKMFINYKVDITQPTGRRIGNMYGFKGGNFAVILNADGMVRHKFMNMMKGDFAERIQETYDDNKALGHLEFLYDMDQKAPKILKYYLIALQRDNESDPKATQVAGELFNALTDEERLSPEYQVLFTSWAPLQHPNIKEYLFSNLPQLREKLGTDTANNTVVRLIHSEFTKNLYALNNQGVDQIIQFLKQNELPNSDYLMGFANILNLLAEKEGRVKVYIKATKNMTTDQIPFADIYPSVVYWHPDRKQEWNAWGKELANQLSNPQMAEFYNKLTEEPK